MNEHDESAPRARNTRKSRALKRPSRWLEKRGAVSSRRASMAPASLAEPSIVPASTGPVTLELEPAETSFDDHAADFFRKGDAEPALAPLDVEADADADGEVDADTARARSTRRRSFSRHVMAVVALSAALCVAGFVRSGTSASAAQRGTNVVTVTPFVVASVTAPLPVAPAPEVAPAAAAAPDPAPAPAAPTEAAPATSGDPPAQLSPIEARAAREDARRALDRGAVAAAITAATTSVELDPTDGDAWLILGAAYQVAGKSAEARNAFASCSKLAKRGDVSECRAFAF